MIIGFRAIDFIRRTNVLSDFRDIKTEIAKGQEHLLELQKNKLIKLLIILKNNNYYEQFLRGIPISTIKKEPYKVLKGFPYIDKNIIRKNHKKIFNPNVSLYQRKFTGGSTGEPLDYFIDIKSISRNLAFMFYFWSLNGYKFGDRHLVIAGNSLCAIGQKWKIHFYHFLQDRTFMEGDWVKQNKFLKNVDKLISGKYKFIYGYPSVLEQYVDFADKNNLRLRKEVIAVFTTSEMLFETTREKLKNFFNVDIIDMYGANDGGLVASEYEYHNGFHYNIQDCIVEDYKSSDINYNGFELVLTNLNSYSFPFVRYRVGDIGKVRKEKCQCGSPLYMITDFQGRIRDCIKTTKGNILHGSLFNQIIHKFSEIEKYQIIQEDNYNIKIILRTASNFGQDRLKQLEDKIIETISDPNIIVESTLTGDFILSKNMKMKTVISYVL